jgi:hypothetical protein
MNQFLKLSSNNNAMERESDKSKMNKLQNQLRLNNNLKLNTNKERINPENGATIIEAPNEMRLDT